MSSDKKRSLSSLRAKRIAKTTAEHTDNRTYDEDSKVEAVVYDEDSKADAVVHDEDSKVEIKSRQISKRLSSDSDASSAGDVPRVLIDPRIHYTSSEESDADTLDREPLPSLEDITMLGMFSTYFFQKKV